MVTINSTSGDTRSRSRIPQRLADDGEVDKLSDVNMRGRHVAKPCLDVRTCLRVDGFHHAAKRDQLARPQGFTGGTDVLSQPH